jgi:hypothetical protein
MRRTWFFVLALIAVVIIIAMFVTKDPDQPHGMDNAVHVAQQEWDGMGPAAQDVACDLFDIYGEDQSKTLMTQNGFTDDMTEAKIDLLKRECT